MIKELKLNNWKSYSEAKLYIDSLTFLIGTNASGKSNILDAFIFLQRLASGASVLSAVNGDTSYKELRGGVEWVTRKGQISFSIEICVELNKKDYQYEIGFRKTEKGIEIEKEVLTGTRRLFWTTNNDTVDNPIIDVYFYTAKRGREKKLTVNRSYTTLSQIDSLLVIKEVKEVALQINELLKNIFILDPIPNHMRIYSKLSDQLMPDASNIAGVLAAIEDEQRKTIEEKLTKYLKPLPEKDIDSVFVEKVGRFESDAMLYCIENWVQGEPIEVDARGMSDGTLRFLAIITALLLGKPNSLLIVEEIDNGLHPSRSENLVRVLKELSSERQIDILCTTHNPVLINSIGNEMIPYISCVKRDDSSGASEIILLEEVENLPKLMAVNSIGGLMTMGEI